MGGGFGSRPVIWLEDLDLDDGSMDDRWADDDDEEETAEDVIQTVKEASDR